MGQPAIEVPTEGRLHGPYNARDVLATHILKQTPNEQASYAIQDTPDMVREHYGRFLPHAKAPLSVETINHLRAAWTQASVATPSAALWWHFGLRRARLPYDN